MALAVAASGTTTPVINTESVLATLTTGKTFVLALDTGAMLNGDILEVRIRTRVLAGGASLRAYSVVYAHVQGAPQKYSIPVPANIEFVAAMTQTAGTARAYPWSVLSLD